MRREPRIPEGGREESGGEGREVGLPTSGDSLKKKVGGGAFFEGEGTPMQIVLTIQARSAE